MDEFIITACPHAVTVAPDFATFTRLVAVARDCDAALMRDGDLHESHHIHDGTDCWICCPETVIDPHGILD